MCLNNFKWFFSIFFEVFYWNCGVWFQVLKLFVKYHKILLFYCALNVKNGNFALVFICLKHEAWDSTRYWLLFFSFIPNLCFMFIIPLYYCEAPSVLFGHSLAFSTLIRPLFTKLGIYFLWPFCRNVVHPIATYFNFNSRYQVLPVITLKYYPPCLVWQLSNSYLWNNVEVFKKAMGFLWKYL